MTAKQTIVWDLDDVLNTLTESWLDSAWHVEHPEAKISYVELRSNPPVQELQATREEYLKSLDAFRLSPAAQNMRPNPLVLAWFERAGDQFHHHVLTARPLHCVPGAAAWVFTHFGRWVRHFHFVPSPRAGTALPAYDTTKAALLDRIVPADIFVDDLTENISAAAARGIRTFLFPQPWNRSVLAVDHILAELSRSAAAEFPHPHISSLPDSPGENITPLFGASCQSETSNPVPPATSHSTESIARKHFP